MALEERIVKKHLYEWLLDHNSIIIPHLGRFDATPTSATIQQGVYKFLPPNKKVTFNAVHEATDVQLRDVLIERENLTTEQANHTISTFVQKVKEALASRQRYELEGFGILSQVNEDTVIFRIDEETNVEGNSYGLPGLYPKPLTHQEVKEATTQASSLSRTDPDLPPYKEQEEIFIPLTKPETLKSTTQSPIVDNDITIEEKRVSRSGNTLLVGTLTVLFLVGVVFVIWLILDSNSLSSSTTNVLSKKEDKKEENQSKEIPKETPKTEEVKEDLEKTPPKSTTPKLDYTANLSYATGFSWIPQPPTNLAQVLNNKRSGKSFTVLGSFDKAENAYSFYNNLVKRAVSTACIIAPVAGNTRYRVCLGKFDSVEQATQEGLAFGKINSTAFFVLTY